MAWDPSIGFVVENSLTAVIIIAYLGYEIYFGRFAGFQERMEGVVDAVVALAREHKDIDEEKVAERVNGESPADLIKDGEEESGRGEKEEVRQSG